MYSPPPKTHFHHVALTPDGECLVGGHGRARTREAIDGRAGNGRWIPARKAAHPKLALTAPAAQCPPLIPTGKIQGCAALGDFIVGGRRPGTIPTGERSNLTGNTACSWGRPAVRKATAAMGRQAGVLRHDPFAMLHVLRLNMGIISRTWLLVAQRTRPRQAAQNIIL